SVSVLEDAVAFATRAQNLRRKFKWNRVRESYILNTIACEPPSEKRLFLVAQKKNMEESFFS
ncbi:MAG: hypothetical protein ACI9GM_001643, partial [Salibacteraceae bacterium]